jgi:uncharacterized membrane protein YidH (DUF202 family)
VLPPNGARGGGGVNPQTAEAADRQDSLAGGPAEAESLAAVGSPSAAEGTALAESPSPAPQDGLGSDGTDGDGTDGDGSRADDSHGDGSGSDDGDSPPPGGAAGAPRRGVRRLIPGRRRRSRTGAERVAEGEPAGDAEQAATAEPASERPARRNRRAPGWLAAAFSVDIGQAVLSRLTVLPVILMLAWLLPGVPLLLAGDFSPVPMLLISVPLAVALCINGLRVVPASWPRLLSAGRTQERGWTVWFGLLATVAIVAGLTGWQLNEGSQALIVVRDPGTYLQTAYWISQHGSLPIPDALRAFGGVHPGLHFATAGFLARGHSLYPAATSGLPILLAGAFWVHGVGSATAFGPVLGGLATLTFAGLVARLVGPQWAPAGALILGLCLPQQYVSRTSLAETALEVMLLGGLCLLADSLALRRLRPAASPPATPDVPEIQLSATEAPAADEPAVRPLLTETPAAGEGLLVGTAEASYAGLGGLGDEAATDGADTAVLPAPLAARSRWFRGAGRHRRLAALRHLPGRLASLGAPPRLLALLAGLSLGFSLVISLDGLAYLVAAIPFACALVIGRRQQAAPFLAGSGLGVCYGLVGCFLLDRPFLDSVGETVALGGVVGVWLIALSIAAILLARLKRVQRVVPASLRRRPLRWLPEVGALIAVALLVGFAIRPYVQTVHGHPSLAEYKFVASLQRLQGLRVDPTRVYSEQTLWWVSWYIGVPTVLLGAAGLAIVLRRCLRSLVTWRDPAGVWREWALPLAMICGGSAVVLWAPDITPDQPWASRRIVVMVIPGLILFALAAASWLGRRARDRGARPLTAAVAGVFCVAAMLVPTVATTFGLGFSHSGQSGGLKPIAQGLALTRTGAGESAAVSSLCAQIPHGASVVIVGRPTASEFAQVIRGMCGVPVAWMARPSVAQVDNVLGAIATAGRRPLLIAGSQHALATYGGSPVRVLDLSTTEDPHDLIKVPTVPEVVRYQLWMTTPAAPGVGA